MQSSPDHNKRYFSQKSFEQVLTDTWRRQQRSKKTLGWASLSSLGIGAIIGAGIFVLTGTAAAKYAGPGVMLSFLLSGLACAFVGLCYAESSSNSACLRQAPDTSATYCYAWRNICLVHRLDCP
jgi:APA family basic amino acid/polyamine antiporter